MAIDELATKEPANRGRDQREYSQGDRPRRRRRDHREILIEAAEGARAIECDGSRHERGVPAHGLRRLGEARSKSIAPKGCGDEAEDDSAGRH